ncbi:MAG: magnesium/cobalt transporter CorA [Bacteroidota bacterium]
MKLRRTAGRRSRKAGLPPGTLVYTGEARTTAPKISVFDYAQGWCDERNVKTAEEALQTKRKGSVRWIDVDGLQQTSILETIGNEYGIHKLVLEDILQTGQRPKLEDYDDYLFVVLKMLRYNSIRRVVDTEQVALVIGPKYILSFQEGVEGDVFEPIRQRLRNHKGHLRSLGPDYLAYSLLDAIVDQYFLILEELEDRVEDVEEELLNEPTRSTMDKIYRLKREMLTVRKSIWPLREVTGQLQRGESTIIKRPTRIYLRDLYDHTVAVLDTLENEREVIAGMLEIYLSSVSNRLNEVMKVLTIIATIFIPLTFVVGVYGMNFDPDSGPLSMPELRWAWGYPAVMVIMAGIGLTMLYYFRKKKWF